MKNTIKAFMASVALLIGSLSMAQTPPQVILPSTMPPVFLAVAQDDLLVRETVLNFNQALQTSKHDSEVHIFSSGGHGFGMIPQGTTSDHWIDELYWWLQAKGMVSKTTPSILRSP